jgi:SAM-dependent methyltransferase
MDMIEIGIPGEPATDGRLDAPAFHRNHCAIWSALAPFLQNGAGDVLEAGSGTGQHVVTFARAAPHITWWPSDHDTRHLESINAWRLHTQLPNLRAPVTIDLSADDWGLRKPGAPPDTLLAIFCANVIHIAPWCVAEGLLKGAARHLRADGYLFLYGPFMRNGEHTAPSNAAFDASLRRSNAEWGVRAIEDVQALAGHVGLKLAHTVEMPANNLILIFERKGRGPSDPSPTRSPPLVDP